MWFMASPPFPRMIKLPDFEFFVRSRLSQEVVYWPQQAIPLVGYMGWPNDPVARAAAKKILRGWSKGAEVPLPGLRRIQSDWTRVADICSLHYDLHAGGHQVRRGGSSIAKAIALANANSSSRGLGIANLWRCWKSYKHVAHLVTAATIICSHARSQAKVPSRDEDPEWFAVRPFGQFGLQAGQFQPFIIAMMTPDFVIAVALWWQKYGLTFIPHSRREPLLDPATAWLIRRDVNVARVAPAQRKLTRQDILLLNKRRAHKGRRAN